MSPQAIAPVHISPPTKLSSAPKLVKVGIVGLGDSARLFANSAGKSDKAKIIAGFSRSAAERRSFQLETRVPVVSDLKTLLSYPMLDGVILTVPGDHCAEIATQAASAKKHILIAGAVGSTLEEGFEIAALESRYGVAVTTASFVRMLGGVQKTRETIESGELGTIDLIEANFSAPEAFAEDSNDSSAQRHNTPDGMLAELAAQQFDVLQYLGGEVEAVSAMVSSTHSPTAESAALSTTTLLKFANGQLGYASRSRTSPRLFAVRVFGSKATMHYEVDVTGWSTPPESHESSNLRIQRMKDSRVENETLAVAETDVYRAQLERFAKTCRTGTSGDFSAAKANASLAIAEAAMRSVERRGQYVRIADVLRNAQSRIHALAPTR